MKRILPLFLDALLVLLVVFLALGLALTAAEAGPLSPGEGCVQVSIAVSPDCVSVGDTITVSGSIQNCSPREVVEVTLDLLGLAEIEDSSGKGRHLKPKFITPPGRKNTREFSFQAKVLDNVAPDVYHITLRAEGKKSGVYAEDYARLTVGECGVILPY
jgi:hypothetical protein